MPVSFPYGVIPNVLTWFQEREVKEWYPKLPSIMAKAEADWVKFKMGMSSGLFTRDQISEIVGWYADLPDLWAGVRSHWATVSPDRPVSSHGQAFVKKTDAFMERLRGEPVIVTGGLSAVLLIAGLVVAAAFGVAGLLWGLGHLKKQQNVSDLIRARTAGRISEGAFQAAVAEVQKDSGGILGNLSDIFKWVAVLAAGSVLVPIIRKAGSIRGRAS